MQEFTICEENCLTFRTLSNSKQFSTQFVNANLYTLYFLLRYDRELCITLHYQIQHSMSNEISQ